MRPYKGVATSVHFDPYGNYAGYSIGHPSGLKKHAYIPHPIYSTSFKTIRSGSLIKRINNFSTRMRGIHILVGPSFSHFLTLGKEML